MLDSLIKDISAGSDHTGYRRGIELICRTAQDKEQCLTLIFTAQNFWLLNKLKV